MAEQDARLVGITPAMCEGSGMVEFAEKFPQRYFDVGIAEQHALTFAAGLACDGSKPVVAIYSTFLQRAYDQLIHDIAIQNLPVMFAIDRGGLVGADGATHAGSFDLSYLRCVPNMTVMAPADENECRQMLSTAFHLDTPSAVRYPRGTGPGVAVQKDLQTIPVGKGEVRRQGSKVAILAFGSMLAPALQAAEQLDATVANMRFVKPLDEELVLQLARDHDFAGHGGRKHHSGRRRQCRGGMSGATRHRKYHVASGSSGRVPRTGRPRANAGRLRPGREWHCQLHQAKTGQLILPDHNSRVMGIIAPRPF